MTTPHKSITTVQTDLAEAENLYAAKLNEVVGSGDVMSLHATGNILNAVSNLVVAQSRAIETLLAAVGALARDAGRMDIAVDEGFETP